MATTVVVGGTGIISTGITRQLVAAGHDVTVFNRGQTDVDLPPEVERIRGDRLDYEAFASAMAELDPEWAIDMVPHTPADAESALRAFDGVEGYLFCSTTAVYDQPVGSYPITEETPRKAPGERYGEAKRAAEDRFLEAHAAEGFPVSIIRPGWTYGEGGTRGGLVYPLGFEETQFVDRLRRGKPIVVHGDGTVPMFSCHRDDVAAAFVNAVGNERAIGETYNVPNPDFLTWNEYLRTLARALDAPEPELVHVPTEQLDAVVPEERSWVLRFLRHLYVFDVSKAAGDLGFDPTVSLEEGFARTVAWLDERGAIEDADDHPLDDRITRAWRSTAADFEAAFEDDA